MPSTYTNTVSGCVLWWLLGDPYPTRDAGLHAAWRTQEMHLFSNIRDTTYYELCPVIKLYAVIRDRLQDA